MCNKDYSWKTRKLVQPFHAEYVQNVKLSVTSIVQCPLSRDQIGFIVSRTELVTTELIIPSIVLHLAIALASVTNINLLLPTCKYPKHIKHTALIVNMLCALRERKADMVQPLEFEICAREYIETTIGSLLKVQGKI